MWQHGNREVNTRTHTNGYNLRLLKRVGRENVPQLQHVDHVEVDDVEYFHGLIVAH